MTYKKPRFYVQETGFISTIGEALFPLEGYEEVKKVVRFHHERIDGRGYPDGLKGIEIPYLARILSVADTFDAMTTQRSYNKVKTLDEAFEELRLVSKKRPNCSNNGFIQQLDPYIVDVFISTIENNCELMEEFKSKELSTDKRNKVKK